ncbi:MAG: hypothetical protein ABEJ07_00835 [Candidatus Nanohaloarchaea archaeon]
MKNKIFAALLVLVAATGMTSSVTAATDSSQRNATVNVTIGSEVAIDVHPQRLKYTGLNPGQTADETQEERGFGTVELENVGSRVIERVWVNATQTTSQSAFYGSTNPSSFDSANFLQIRPAASDSPPLQGDTGNWTYVNRRDYGAYNNSLNPEYIHAPDSGDYYVDVSGTTATSASEVAIGRFRMGDQEYFWALPVGGNGACNGDSTNTFNTLLIAKQPHNSTDTVPVDFTATDGSNGPDGGTDAGYNTIPGRDYVIQNITNNAGNNYGVVGAGSDSNTNGVPLKDTSESGQIRVYDILTQCDTGGNSGQQDTDKPHTIRTRYNVEAGDYSDLANFGSADRSQYLIAGNNQLDPNQAVNLGIRVMVPRGIPQGVVSQGVLRVVVSTSNAA